MEVGRAASGQPQLQQPGRRFRGLYAPLLLLVSSIAVFPALLLSKLETQDLVPARAGGEASAGEAVAVLMRFLQDQLKPLKEQIGAGHIVPKFGEKAQAVMSSSIRLAGNSGLYIQPAVDGMLQALFLEQLAILRQQIVAKFKKSRSVESVTQADRQFVTQAEELRRQGSNWRYEEERYALRASLESGYRREAALAEERALAVQSQQSTVEIISKLQSQMENLQQRVQHLRAGSPWFLSSSYRIPKTPIQLIGRYQQGRGSIELNLSPDRDPANAEAGFVTGVGPANLGINGNLGF